MHHLFTRRQSEPTDYFSGAPLSRTFTRSDTISSFDGFTPTTSPRSSILPGVNTPHHQPVDASPSSKNKLSGMLRKPPLSPPLPSDAKKGEGRGFFRNLLSGHPRPLTSFEKDHKRVARA